MNNTPKTVEDLFKKNTQLISAGELAMANGWVIYNLPKLITALNELIRNERIDELNKLMDYTDENEIVCVCEQANVEVCDHNWSLCHTAREHIAELRAEERLQK